MTGHNFDLLTWLYNVGSREVITDFARKKERRKGEEDQVTAFDILVPW